MPIGIKNSFKCRSGSPVYPPAMNVSSPAPSSNSSSSSVLRPLEFAVSTFLAHCLFRSSSQYSKVSSPSECDHENPAELERTLDIPELPTPPSLGPAPTELPSHTPPLAILN